MAVGGYGRGELAPYSDLDLLFLRAWKETPHSESVIEFILYSLWDLGLKVGHASRTVDESLKMAREDHTVMTALLEYRPLAGDSGLVQYLKEKLALDVMRHGASDFVTAKLEERDFRHAKAGTTRYVVEPNLKEGKGGLRDLHTLFWIAKYLAGATPAPVLRESQKPQAAGGMISSHNVLVDQAFRTPQFWLLFAVLFLNVTAGIGVVEGNGGRLRAGLPWQAVHDGEGLAHAPLRLSVMVEAPEQAIADILHRHPGVKALFDNGWLSLFTLDQGRVKSRWRPGAGWEGDGMAKAAA